MGDRRGGVTSAGEIFRTDLTGDGTVEDIFPTSRGEAEGKLGQFGRSVSATGFTNLINSWNSTVAGTLTPAGQALVGAGLFTTAQLQELGAVKPFVALPLSGALGQRHLPRGQHHAGLADQTHGAVQP